MGIRKEESANCLLFALKKASFKLEYLSVGTKLLIILRKIIRPVKIENLGALSNFKLFKAHISQKRFLLLEFLLLLS